MCPSSGVSFSSIVHVFLMKMVWKRLEVIAYCYILLLFAWPFIEATCWKPEIFCCTEEFLGHGKDDTDFTPVNTH